MADLTPLDEKLAEVLGLWEIAAAVDDAGAQELARWAVPVQRKHVDAVREAYLGLAVEEAEEMARA